MAAFTVDPEDPTYVVDAQNRKIPASLVDPADIAPTAPPAGMSPRAQEVLGKLDTVRSKLPVSSTSTSTTVIPGRDLKMVTNQIKEEEQAGANVDRSVLDTAKAAEDRADASTLEQQKGVQSTAARDVAAGFAAKQEQQRIAADKTKLEQDLKANDESFDADRLVNQMSTGRKIGLTILAMINGAFANLSGNQNSVMSVLQNRIDEDIKAQKDQIAAGRVRIGNQIAELMQKGYTAEQAEKLARDRLDAGVDRMIQLTAQRAGTKGSALEQANLLVAQRQEARAARRNELLASTEDRTQTSSTVNREAPRAPGPEDALKQAQILQARLEEMDANEIAKVISVPDEDGKQRPVSVKRAKAAVDGAADLAVKLPRADVAEQQLANVLKEAGVPLTAYNRDTGTIDWSQVKDLSGVGQLDSRWGAGTNALGLTNTPAQKVVDAAAALQESLTYLTTGAVASPTQSETFRKQSGGWAKNEQSFKENLSRTANQIATQRRSMLSGNPDATRLYEYNRTRGTGTGSAGSLKPGVN